MPAVGPPRVFVSATSADLGTARRIAKEALLSVDCMPVEQTNFPPDYRTLIESLRQKLSECDAMIHIVGLRYGAEPDPNRLPQGATRRSYTQLEYEFARELNKRVYIFVCSEDFPYDRETAPESEEKHALQRDHRKRLTSAGFKYERVSVPETLELRVRELREQIDKLRQAVTREQRRQLFAWVATAVAILALATVAVVGFGYLRRDGRAIEEKVEDARQSGQGAEDAARKNTAELVSLRDFLRRGEVLEVAARAAGVERGVVESLLKQAEERGSEPLAYAENLSAKGRYSEAASLALVIAEASLRKDRADFRTASSAFKFAGQNQMKQALSPAAGADAAARLVDAERLLQRAHDANEAAPDVHRDPEYRELIQLRVECFLEAGNQTEVSKLPERKRLHEQALVIASQSIEKPPADPGLDARTKYVAALCLVTNVQYLTELEAKATLARALAELDQALPGLETAGRIGDWHQAVRVRTAAVRWLVPLGSELEGQKLVDEVRQLAEAALGRKDAEAHAQVLDFTELHLANAQLWLQENPRSDDERRESLRDAERRFRRVFDRHKDNWDAEAKVRAAHGLITCACKSWRTDAAGKLFEELAAHRQFGGLEAILAYARYAVAYAVENMGYRGSAELLELASKEVAKMLSHYSYGVAPDAHIRLRFAAASLHYQLSKMPPSPLEDKKTRVEPFQRVESALDELGRIERLCPRSKSPITWAKVRVTAGVYMLGLRTRRDPKNPLEEFAADFVGGYEKTTTAFNDALRLYAKQDSPNRRGYALYYLGCTERSYGQDDESQAIPRFEEALACWDIRHAADTIDVFVELAQAYTRITFAKREPAARRDAWRKAITFALRAGHWCKGAGYNSREQFDALVKDLQTKAAKKLSMDEQVQIERDIEAIRREVEKTPAPDPPKTERG